MSNEAADNSAPERKGDVSGDKIQQLIAIVGSQRADSSDQIEAAEYNWRQPHYFSIYQLKMIDDFTKKTAEAMAEKFSALCHGDFNVTIVSTTQHFADELLTQPADNESQRTENYYLTFGADHSEPFGLVGIPTQTAISWTTQLLGDTESTENSDRKLSQLEKSLLLDIASALIDALSTHHNSYNFQPVGHITTGRLPLELERTEQLCKITFDIKKPDSQEADETGKAYFLIPSSRLESVVGNNVQADNEFSSEDVSKAMLEHIHQTPVSVTAQLASAELTFEELINLQPDDILLLDKKISEPIELIVEGKTVLHGKPAKSDGRYAVVITETQ
ncbi:MAG: hypothetical protein DRP62_05880 [Planctomycetota bacterium]|nr:MAG: hypothetical protein DRP62_05880 [Planctomycetota bacterium]